MMKFGYLKLMGQETYDRFAALQERLSDEGLETSNTFVPVASVKQASAAPRVLFVGQATRCYIGFDDTYDAAADTGWQVVRDFLPSGNGFFWQFVREVMRDTLQRTGMSGDDAAGMDLVPYVGWSNLAKIGVEYGNPTGDLLKAQSELCVASLREDIETMAPQAVVVASGYYASKEVLYPLFGAPDDGWSLDAPCGEILPYKRWNGTRVIWTDHPRRLRVQRQWPQVVDSIVQLVAAT